MCDVFLGHKSEDKEKAQKIAVAIEKEGYSVWWDLIIPPGKTWAEYIEQKLAAAKCVVVLWSRESIKSKWVNIEATEGDRRRILVPVLIEDVVPPLAFRPIEAAELVEWDGTSSHHEFQLLLKSIRGFLNRPQVSEIENQKQPEQEVKEIKKKELASKDKEIQVLKTPEQEVEEFKEDDLTSKAKDTPVLNKPIHEYMQERMVEIPAGKFIMGDDYYGRREVIISRSFLMDKYPVTQNLYFRVMKKKPSHFIGKDLPVENINWFDAVEFCNELSRTIGLQEAYEVNEEIVERKIESDGYRLPTEAEWEYACRVNTTDKREGKLDEIAWYNKKETHKVGKYPKGKGVFLYDMLGNVWEWCGDRFSKYPKNQNKPDIDPTGPDNGESYIMRGGSWQNFSNAIKCTHRSGDSPDMGDYNTGFRLVLPLNHSQTSVDR